LKDDAIYLGHILECIRRAEENTSAGYDAFMESHTLQDAVLRNLQTMSESTQRISDAVKGANPGVDWRAISGFRNVLVHNYLGIDLDQVWNTFTRDVPVLKTVIEAALRTLLTTAPSENSEQTR
jgi:uncharacterized protein with HEPN domain